MKNIILKYYFKITVVGIFSAFLFGCSGLKVMVETEQPDDDFVVECVWSSKNFKIHGGRAEVHRKAFVASSGEIVDCGTFWHGVMSYVQILHPLYVYGNEYEKNIYDSKGGIKYTVSVYKMKLVEEYLDDLIKNLKGRKLSRVVLERFGGGLSGSYLPKYNSVKKFESGYFKKKYRKRIEHYWRKLLPVIIDELERRGLENVTVEGSIENYWEIVEEYEREYKKEYDQNYE